MQSNFKLRRILSILFLFGSLQTITAQSVKDIFNTETPVTYLGIDFTNVKLIGDATADEIEIRDKYFTTINEVVINEPKKYNFQSTFKKSNISNDLSLVMAKNAKTETGKIKSQDAKDDSRFTKETIEQIIKGYDFSNKKGIGLMFIMETLNKTASRASMYVTFVDMNNKKVLFTERLTGKSGGFGFRNYWARTVYEVLESIQKSRYKEWEKNNQTVESTAAKQKYINTAS